MATATKASQFLSQQLVLPLEDLRTRVRTLRHSGLLPQGTKGPTAPHLRTEELVSLFIAAVAGGPQSEADRAVRTVWQLQMSRVTWETPHNSKFAERGQIDISAWPSDILNTNFGNAICALVDSATTAQGRQQLLEQFLHINVWADGTTAAFAGNGVQPNGQHGIVTYWFEEAPDPNALPSAMALAPVRRMTQAPIAALVLLADLVIEGRVQAAKQISRTTESNLANEERAAPAVRSEPAKTTAENPKRAVAPEGASVPNSPKLHLIEGSEEHGNGIGEPRAGTA